MPVFLAPHPHGAGQHGTWVGVSLHGLGAHSTSAGDRIGESHCIVGSLTACMYVQKIQAGFSQPIPK